MQRPNSVQSLIEKRVTGYRRVARAVRPVGPRLMYHNIGTVPCRYGKYKCPSSSIEGYCYCPTHILCDSKAPFQQCSFTYSATSKRCFKAAAKNDLGESFCPEHLQAMLRARSRVGRSKPPNTSTRLMTTLQHHCQGVNPFVDVDATAVNKGLSNVLDFCSESDSDVDGAVIGNTASRCWDEDWSDAESVDSCDAGEDALKTATVLTSDEAMKRTTEKTQRLRNLYADQLTRLQHVLMERRRDYLQSIQAEKETTCSIAEQCAASGTHRDLNMLDKLRAYNQYRRTFGRAALLRRKMKMKKAGMNLDLVCGGRHTTKCVYTEGGVKCSARTLPASKFCLKHILNDASQQLFSPCGRSVEDTTCQEPLTPMDPCTYHTTQIPTTFSYNMTLSSEDDDDHKLNSLTKDESEYEIDNMREPGSEEGEVKLPLYERHIVYADFESYGQEVVVDQQ